MVFLSNQVKRAKSLAVVASCVSVAFSSLLLTQNFALAQDLTPPNKQGLENTVKQKTKRVFTVGVSNLNRYPMFSFGENGSEGFGWAVLDAFAKDANIEFRYVPMSMARLQPSMDAGSIDFIFPDNPLWVNLRSSKLPNIYSSPVISSISATFVNAQNKDMTIDQVEKVSIPFGYTAYTWVAPINNYGIVSQPVKSVENGLYTLKIASADAADVEYNIGAHIINTDNYWKGLILAKNLPNAEVHYHLSSIKHIVVLEKLSNFIEANPAMILALKDKYNVKYHSEIFPNK